MRFHLSRHRATRAFAVLAVLAATTGLNAQWANAVHDDDVFELEGNLVDNTGAGTAPDDWVTLQAGGGSADDFTGIINDRVSDTTYYNGGGSKDHIDIPSWGSSGNSAPPKDEITNAYAASYTVGGDHVIYFGVDRGAVNGDAQMGFWFFQDAVGPDGLGGFDGEHVARDTTPAGTADDVHGDVLVLSDFTKGGKVGSVKVFEWVGDGSGSHGNLDLILSENATTASPECGNSAQPTPDDVCAVENSGSVPVPTTGWSYNGTQFAKGAFIEGGINVSALFPGANSCFASFQAETRSSQETTATLKDFANGDFEACFPSTTLSAGAASPAVVHTTEGVTATFTETNDGDLPLTAPSNGFFECSADKGNTTAVAPVLKSAPNATRNVGDTNNDGVLDEDEAWQFNCTVTSAVGSGTVTLTGTGHGLDADGNDVTYCTDPTAPPTGVACDQDELATTTFSIINPSTTMASSVSAVVTYTFTETNNGDGPLTRTSALNYVRSSDCTIAERLTSGTVYNIGDTDQDGVLDGTDTASETWTFTCQRTFTSLGSVSTVAIGHGTDSATTGKDVTYCDDPTAPPSGVFCDQDERQSITVNITNP